MLVVCSCQLSFFELTVGSQPGTFHHNLLEPINAVGRQSSLPLPGSARISITPARRCSTAARKGRARSSSQMRLVLLVAAAGFASLVSTLPGPVLWAQSSILASVPNRGKDRSRRSGRVAQALRARCKPCGRWAWSTYRDQSRCGFCACLEINTGRRDNSVLHCLNDLTHHAQSSADRLPGSCC
jgi:hypothetical protein